MPITVITGPMFAGKTSRLIREICVQGLSLSVNVFRPLLDTRDPVMKSHDGVIHETSESVSTIADIIAKATANMIIIDEVQFFFEVSDDELVGLQKLSLTKNIIIAGLDRSFKNVPFETTAKMMAIADKVEKLTAKCACGLPATHTQILGTKPLTTYHPGNDDLYVPTCSPCTFGM